MDRTTPTQTLTPFHAGGVKKEWTVVKREGKTEKLPWPLIKRGFTEAQRRELQEQQVISTHISAGLPVPPHLVLPIWKSVVSSLGPSSNLLPYKPYPSFSGYILSGLDCENMTTQEPGRCRRTDGKKWRCSRAVIAEQKYCERHIHRGRRRSRKLVEASEIASPFGTSATNSSITSTAARPQNPDSLQIPDPNHSVVCVGLQLMTPSSSNVTVASHGFERVRPYVTAAHAAHGTAGAGSTPAWISHYNNSIVARSHMAPGSGFWPKTAVQAPGHGGPFLGNQAHEVFEPMRCRRTDGKKWQCMKEVVTGQKYCPRHMHRGAKRLSQSLVPIATIAAPPPHPPVADIHTGPDTNLCISIPTSPPPKEKCGSTTSSDTTVTDTSN